MTWSVCSVCMCVCVCVCGGGGGGCWGGGGLDGVRQDRSGISPPLCRRQTLVVGLVLPRRLETTILLPVCFIPISVLLLVGLQVLIMGAVPVVPVLWGLLVTLSRAQRMVFLYIVNVLWLLVNLW